MPAKSSGYRCRRAAHHQAGWFHSIAVQAFIWSEHMYLVLTDGWEAGRLQRRRQPLVIEGATSVFNAAR